MAKVCLEVSPAAWEAWESFLASGVPGMPPADSAALGDLVIEAFLDRARQIWQKSGPVRRRMDKAMRRVLPLFNETDAIVPTEVELILGLQPGQGEPLCESWVPAGFLERDPLRPGRYVIGREVSRETREIKHRTPLWVKKRLSG